MHNDVKPYGETSPCPTKTYDEVVDSLAGALRDKGKRHAIVLTHHPLRSGGIHGGTFTLGDHIFPLRNFKRWLWVPLPLLGSVYPFARQMGISNQDISGGSTGRCAGPSSASSAAYPPLVVASGHDHDLQVIRGGRPRITNAGYQLVSGAGILGHASRGPERRGLAVQARGRGLHAARRHPGRAGSGCRSRRWCPKGERPKGESAEVFSIWLTGEGGT